MMFISCQQHKKRVWSTFLPSTSYVCLNGWQQFLLKNIAAYLCTRNVICDEGVNILLDNEISSRNINTCMPSGHTEKHAMLIFLSPSHFISLQNFNAQWHTNTMNM